MTATNYFNTNDSKIKSKTQNKFFSRGATPKNKIDNSKRLKNKDVLLIRYASIEAIVPPVVLYAQAGLLIYIPCCL